MGTVLQSHYGLNFSTKLFIKITDILTMISTFNQSIHTTFDHFKNILSLSPLLLHNSMSRNNFLKYLHCFVWSIFYNSCPAGAVLLSTKVSCESENFQLFVVEKMYHLLLSIYLSPASQGRREEGGGGRAGSWQSQSQCQVPGGQQSVERAVVSPDSHLNTTHWLLTTDYTSGYFLPPSATCSHPIMTLKQQ